ncbi:MAG TPA: MCE family protein [Acidimicrobiales bacterium]|nr:MCE family protein [Acidimicrobiales bacterium]
MRRAAIAIVSAVAAAVLPGCATAQADSYEVTAFFPKTVALFPSSLVRVIGLPAGKVTGIEVAGASVRVRMRIPASVPIPADAQATIIPLSLIGERYVQLSPAWKEGVPRAKDGMVIPLERTSVPVEPDEALAALKEFLDALDPEATGSLVKNLAADLDGNGEGLNAALEGLGTLTQTFADKDEQLLNIIDHFDRLTGTLASRDQQLGRVLDAFAATTGALADERASLESLLGSLAALSRDGFDLVSEHRARLDKDLTVLNRTLRMVQANIVQVEQLLDSGPLLVAGPGHDGRRGLLGAYDEKYHHLDLRSTTSPAGGQAFAALGLPAGIVCLPIDVSCSVPTGGASARSRRAPAAATTPAGRAAAALPVLSPAPTQLPVPEPAGSAVNRRPVPRLAPGAKSHSPLRGLARLLSGVFG